MTSLPTVETMSDLDKGAALLHLWKREWDGTSSAIAKYPARYLDDPALIALDEGTACAHAMSALGSWEAAGKTYGWDEVRRLYDLALAEENGRRREGLPSDGCTPPPALFDAQRAESRSAARRTNTSLTGPGLSWEYLVAHGLSNALDAGPDDAVGYRLYSGPDAEARAWNDAEWTIMPGVFRRRDDRSPWERAPKPGEHPNMEI